MELLDHDLLLAAQHGDANAIEELLLRYHPTITRFARQFCATPEDVEDAVQETLWVASRKIGSLRVASAFVSWAFQVVKHQCYRLLHFKQREQPLDSLIDLSDADADPELRTLLQRDVVTAIAELPATYRSVLILRDVQEMTAPEVAATLDLSLETVKSRLHRARVILREKLAHWRV